jgi:hypothetical protein
MKDPFAKYEAAVSKAKTELEKTLVSEIQKLLKIAEKDGEFYVCSGMGICNLSADKFSVMYEGENGIFEADDDFALGEKLFDVDFSRYGVKIHCSDDSREALKKVHEICEALANHEEDSMVSLLPYRVYANKIEN